MTRSRPESPRPAWPPPTRGYAGGRPTRRERGHALTTRPPAPDRPAAAVLSSVAFEPRVVDGALRAHPVQHAAHPLHQGGVVRVSAGRVQRRLRDHAVQVRLDGEPVQLRLERVAVECCPGRLIIFAGWPASTSTAAAPVSSSVRPVREFKPNSSAASSASRRADPGTHARRHRAQRRRLPERRGTTPGRRSPAPATGSGRSGSSPAWRRISSTSSSSVSGALLDGLAEHTRAGSACASGPGRTRRGGRRPAPSR